MRERLYFRVLLAGVVVALLLAGCGDKKVQSAAPPAVPVTVAPVAVKSMPLQLQAIGNVQAYKSVAIKPQVNGELTAVHFTEGQDVRRGQPLFTIDRRPFLAALQQAKSTLARDLASAAQARVQANRYLALYKEGVVAKEQLDAVQAQAEALEATVAADRAAVETAEVNLDYTTITAPVAGRTGNLLVHQGNLLKANDEGSKLVVINQIAPIYVEFAIPEQYLEQVREYMRKGKLEVQAVIPGDESKPATGQLTLIDNAVDPGTGTIRLKGTFQNNDKRLWPGQFVNVVLTLAEEPNRIVVPSRAVQTGQSGQFVYVVKGETAEMRPVKVERTAGQESIVAGGLQAGEQVVTDGQSRLVSGARIAIKSSKTAEPAAGGAQ